MKIRIDFTVDLDQKQEKDLIAFARIRGFDWDKPGKRILLKRVLTDRGMNCVFQATEEANGLETL